MFWVFLSKTIGALVGFTGHIFGVQRLLECPCSCHWETAFILPHVGNRRNCHQVHYTNCVNLLG